MFCSSTPRISIRGHIIWDTPYGIPKFAYWLETNNKKLLSLCLGHIPANCRGQTLPWSRCELGQGEESRRWFLHPPTSWNRFTNKPNRIRICDTMTQKFWAVYRHLTTMSCTFFVLHTLARWKCITLQRSFLFFITVDRRKLPPGCQAGIRTRDQLGEGRRAI